jgi:hypothetical protein
MLTMNHAQEGLLGFFAALEMELLRGTTDEVTAQLVASLLDAEFLVAKK